MQRAELIWKIGNLGGILLNQAWIIERQNGDDGSGYYISDWKLIQLSDKFYLGVKEREESNMAPKFLI